MKKHLSVFGIGPVYAALVVSLSLAGLVAASLGWLAPGDVPGAAISMTIAGVVLVLLGVGMGLSAHVASRLFEQVRQNQLVTTGIYAWVRNPVYSGWMIAAAGVLLMAHNLWLLLLPVLFWAMMKPMLACTEEKWLLALYGEPYAAYCRRVNRCIPWFPARR